MGKDLFDSNTSEDWCWRYRKYKEINKQNT